jgi:hypothetical protein
MNDTAPGMGAHPFAVDKTAEQYHDFTLMGSNCRSDQGAPIPREACRLRNACSIDGAELE